MIVVFGTLTCGQADVVDKRFSVATEFFHIMWFPLIPTGGCVVFDQQTPKKILAKVRSDESDETEPEPAEETQAAESSSDGDDQELRIPIPMSGKSVLLGYIRGWGFWLTLFCGFLGGMLWLMSLGGSDPEAAGMFPGFLITAGAGLVLAMGSYYGPWNRATPQRANELCQAVGLDPDTLPNEYRSGAEPG